MISVLAPFRLVRFLLTVSLSTVVASAQCSTEWLQGVGDGFPREGEVHASTMWDPDGPGPLAERLVLAGNMNTAHHIASLNPATGEWSAVGLGTNGTVRALAAMPNGDLIACGEFTYAGGGTPDRRIARWDGLSWHPLGFGLGSQSQGIVLAVTVLPNGDVVAGGSFLAAGGVVVNRIARWDGTSWSAMGTGMNGNVYSLATLPNGDVVAGGLFSTAGGVPAGSIARWDGSSWSALGLGMPASTIVEVLEVMPNGDVVAGGQFPSAGGLAASNVARWNGSNWQPLGAGTSGGVTALDAMANGDLLVGGAFASAGGVAANRVARWNGASWSTVGAGVDLIVETVAELPGGHVVVAGASASYASARIARFDGGSWHDLGSGLGNGIVTGTPVVDAMACLPNGHLVATGSFRNFGEVLARGVAQWDGAAWLPLANGLPGPHTRGSALAVMPNADLIVGGQFGTSAIMHNIARWDGSSWSGLGSGLSARVSALLVLPNGDLIAGGDFTLAGGVLADHIARWDGVSWSPLGAGLSGSVYELARLPNGDIVAGGLFTMAGGVAANNIARWDGASWSPLGGGLMGLVTAILALPNGELLAGASGATGGIARWDGSTWSPLGAGVNGLVQSLAFLPNGDLVAGGLFTTAGPVVANNIARWDGAVWSALGNEMDSVIDALALMPNGELAVGGSFGSVEGRFSAGIARVTTTCVASVVPTGTGCPSSGGNNHYAADSLPWTGATFTATGTGLPAFAFVATVTGFTTTSLPLSQLLPQGQLGCELLVTPDAVEFAFSTSSTFATAFTIPNAASLAGIVVHSQLLPFEVDASLHFTAITASNALTLTVGAF